MKAIYKRHFGSDLDVVNDAKVSFAKASTELGPKEINLINYLARGIPSAEFKDLIGQMAMTGDENDIERIVDQLMHTATHWVPFTHNGITLAMEAPVPIRVHCFKHKIGFTESEESRRYITSRPILHVPTDFHVRPDNIKQGSSDVVHQYSTGFMTDYIELATKAIDKYEEVVNAGIAPEEARYILPQGVEVNWIWTGNLAAYARYYNQRSDGHAQGDSQLLAEEVRKIVEPLFPYSWKALTRKWPT